MRLILIALLFTLPAFGEIVEIGETVNVRSEPTTGENVIGTAEAGQKFEVSAVREWLKVEFKDGRAGWVWFEMVDGEKIGGQGCTVHASPQSGKQAGDFAVKAGTEFRITARKRTWFKILGTKETKFKAGWFSARFAKE